MIKLNKDQFVDVLVAFYALCCSKRGDLTNFPLVKQVLPVRTTSFDGLRHFEVNNQIFSIEKFISFYFDLWAGLQ